MKHNFLRRLGALTLVFALALSLMVTPAWAAPGDPELKVTTDPEQQFFVQGDAFTLVVAKIENGVTTPVPVDEYEVEFDKTGVVEKAPNGNNVYIATAKNGTVRITVKLKDGSLANTCTVVVGNGDQVTDRPAMTVRCIDGPLNQNGDGILLAKNGTKTATLWADVTGTGTENLLVTWESSDPNVAACDEVDGSFHRKAVITPGNKTGKTDIVVTLKHGSSGVLSQDIVVKYTVYVSEITVEIERTDTGKPVNGSSGVPLERDKSLTFYAAVKDGGNALPVGRDAWSVNPQGIIDLTPNNDGTATIKALDGQSGTVTITVTSSHGASASFNVVVPKAGDVAVTGVTLNRNELRLGLNETFDLVATVQPSRATNKEVVWEVVSGDGEVSITTTTANGLTARIRAIKQGTVTVRVTSKADYSKYAECTITISPGLTSLTIQKKTASGQFNLNTNLTRPGDEQSVEVEAGPKNAYFNSIEWSSDNSSVVTIRKDPRYTTGLFAILTVVGPGEATITAQCGNVKDTAKVTIPGLVISSGILTMTNGKLTMKEGATEQLTYKGYGAADSLGSTTVPNWISSDSSVVDVDRLTGAVTARKPGTAKITVSVGSYEATCQITVAEDTGGIITLTGNHPSGSPINMNTARGTSDAGSGTIPNVLNAISRAKTGAGLSYVTNLSVASTEQGILHDEHHSADDTGAGVGIQDRYYINANTAQGQRPLSDLSFVPRNTFSGTAEITFTGWSTTRQPFNGTIRISVNGTGDVMYSSSEGSAVSFLASDFNFYHPNLKSVSFTPPQESVGALYYNYTNAGQPGTKVDAGTLYNRTGTPSIDKVTFVPAVGYEGTVKISYRGTDTSNKTFTGVVTITVTKASGSSGNPADISYSTKEDSWTTFRPSDFNTASLRALGESLSYVRFTPPPSNEGTLFYNYRGFSDFDSMVNNTTSYYYSGSPALSGVSFVPTTTTPSRVDIEYTGYTVRGNTFTGTIHIGLNDNPPEQQLLHYTVFTGKTVSLSASDFNSACVAATGTSLNSIQFTRLPGVSQGNLRYTRGNSSTPYNVATNTRFYRTGSTATANLIGNVYFQANANYTGTVTIPFTGTSDNGTTFTDEVVITVTPPTADSITYSGTTASPIRLYASRIQSANSGLLNNVSYITFTSLPSSTAGKLYVGYSGFGTGTQVNTGTRYYVSGYPSIDQISFVPRGRYSGQASVGYTAVSSSGQSVSGRIVFSVSSTGNSSYFSDMYGHTWAGPSVDYLYQNGVTNGITATTFGPNRQILRCDFVLMVCRAFGFTGSGGYSFADVPTNTYFAQAVAAAKQMGIVNGDGGNFRPYSAITRQDAMVIVDNAMRAAGWNVGSASSSVLNQFSDSGSVSSYARSAVSSLVQLGAVNGDNGRLLPHNPITRAEAAVILHFVMTM